MAGCSRTVEPTGLKLKVVGAATHGLLLVRSVVIHVALAWVTLAPGYSCGTMYSASAKYVAPGFSDGFKSLMSTSIR